MTEQSKACETYSTNSTSSAYIAVELDPPHRWLWRLKHSANIKRAWPVNDDLHPNLGEGGARFREKEVARGSVASSLHWELLVWAHHRLLC